MNEYIDAKKAKKLSERAFLQGIIVCVFNVLLCIACLASATFAWLSVSIESPTTTLQTSDYALTIEICDSDGNLLDHIVPTGGGKQFSLAAGKKYTVTLKAEGTSGNGYAIMFVEGFSGNWYTNIISINGPVENPNPTVFTIEPEIDAHVTFDLRWGTSRGIYDISNGDTVTIVADEVSVASGVESESESSSENEAESTSDSSEGENTESDSTSGSSETE